MKNIENIYRFTEEDTLLAEEILDLLQQVFAFHTKKIVESFEVNPKWEIMHYFDTIEEFEQVLFHFIEEWKEQRQISLPLTMKREDIFEIFKTVNDVFVYFFLIARNERKDS